MLKTRRQRNIAIFALVVALVIGLQVWTALSTQWAVREALAELESRDAAQLDQERVRQEALAKSIENRTRAALGVNLAAAIAATIGLIVSLGGVGIAAFAYLETREKERQDRADALAKERDDRLAATLSETLTRLVAEEPRERAVGAAGLIYFFAPERSDLHQQALTALIAAARNEDEKPNVRDGLRLAVEQGVQSIDNAQLRKVSWQRAQLSNADLSGRDLSGLDLRNAVLHNADLSGASLAGANLEGAQLNGADLSGTDLAGANLTGADLAGGTIAGADLPDSRIGGLKILNLVMKEARIGEAVTGWRDLPWEATRDWRQAVFHESILDELKGRYGAEPPPPQRVLMLVWEMPPSYVAGGTWTACYHLVRKLKQRGCDVTVVAPWPREAIADLPFGIDVPIVGLDIVPFADESPYGQATWSPYGGAAGPYGGGGSPYGGGWSPYGGGGPASASPYAERYGGAPPGWSPYGWLRAGPPGWSPYGGVAGPYGSYASDPATAGSTLYRLMGEFRRQLRHYLADRSFDLIHAHDWVTFDAAETASVAIGAPWIAHFHSTEAERQPDRVNPIALRIEGQAAQVAEGVVAPSHATAAMIAFSYGIPQEHIDVIPNLLSEGAPPTYDMGRFETRRVLFIGRLSRQKGVDLFLAAADKARGLTDPFEAEIVGSGEEDPGPGRAWLRRRSAVPWERRGEAFRRASLVVAPSRFEPFGMVILEAMQHRVPVIYPAGSGAAEVLESGIKVDPQDSEAVAGHIVDLLGDLPKWEAAVQAQADEIEAYPGRAYEGEVIRVWQEVVDARAAGKAGGAGMPGGAEPIIGDE